MLCILANTKYTPFTVGVEWKTFGAITEGITGEISAQTNQEICRPLRRGVKQPHFPV